MAINKHGENPSRKQEQRDPPIPSPVRQRGDAPSEDSGQSSNFCPSSNRLFLARSSKKHIFLTLINLN
jgi:hypothetical protein